jgi:hypothetical protein
MNLCRRCGTDFASVAAFDRHRTGSHEYRFSFERLDGRRCMSEDEMLTARMELDPRERWTLAQDADRIATWALEQAA